MTDTGGKRPVVILYPAASRVLIAIAPVAGLSRIVGAAPEVAIALGYDVVAALEEPDGP